VNQLGLDIQKGIPTVTIATTDFVDGARNTAQGLGVPELPVVIVPHPFGGQSKEALRAKADGAFQDILKISDSDYLAGFFPDKNELVKYLFLANLCQSLFEMGRCVEDAECLKSLENVGRNQFELDLDVWPVWTLMKTDEFRPATWELFGSSNGVVEFVFTGGVSPEKFWVWWKEWKKICVHNVMRGELSMREPRIVHEAFLQLAGEPPS